MSELPAISVFEPGRVAQRCEFCGSSSIAPYQEIKPPIQPESLLPLKVGEVQVREAIRKWFGSRWFAPNRLKSAALTDTVSGFTCLTGRSTPAFTRTGRPNRAIITTRTRRTRLQRPHQTRRVQHTRWQPSSGEIDHFFDDELVCASTGVDEALLRKIEPFPTRDLAPYNPGYLAGWVVEHYQIDLIAAAQRSRERMDAEVRQMCAANVPGDTHRNLRVSSRYSDQTFKHILVPVWLLTFDYGAKSFQAVINGYTGQIAGEYPKSWVKILLLILTIAAMAGLIWLLTSGG